MASVKSKSVARIPTHDRRKSCQQQIDSVRPAWKLHAGRKAPEKSPRWRVSRALRGFITGFFDEMLNRHNITYGKTTLLSRAAAHFRDTAFGFSFTAFTAEFHRNQQSRHRNGRSQRQTLPITAYFTTWKYMLVENKERLHGRRF